MDVRIVPAEEATYLCARLPFHDTFTPFFSLSPRFGAGLSGIPSALPPAAASAGIPPEPKLDPIPEGGPGPDWSWWRERCVLLCLSLLDAASEREKAFVDQWRARVSAGGLDDYDEDGSGAGGGGGSRRGGGSLAPPAYLGSLLSEQKTLAVVARCVRACVRA